MMRMELLSVTDTLAARFGPPAGAAAACLEGEPAPGDSALILPAAAAVEPLPGLPEADRRSRTEALRRQLAASLPMAGSVFADDTDRIGVYFSWPARRTLEAAIREHAVGLGLPVTVGVGKPQPNGAAGLRRAYGQAVDALRHAFYRGREQTLYAEELDGYVTRCDYPYGAEEALFEAIRKAADGRALRHAVDRFYDELLLDGWLAPADVFEVTIRLLAGLEKRAFNEHGEAGGYKKYDILTIVRLETLHEVKAYVASFLEELHASAAGERAAEGEAKRNVVAQSIRLMEMSCKDASLQRIAEQVYMTPTYLSLLFKTSTGRTFIEQLTDIRIGEAKRLLETTRLKNYEVADRVGYQDARYFSQIFKKRVGLLPSEYREAHAR